ncbi:uncharacterized protein DEA37_0011889, partial [Paragonimus westermani]
MECMDLLCSQASGNSRSNGTGCHPCRNPFTDEDKSNWIAYIDIIERNWEADLEPFAYYSRLRTHPSCCTAIKGSSCRLRLIKEPQRDPKNFYDLTCVDPQRLPPLLCDNAANLRCCTEDHCNIPSMAELDLLRKEPSSNFQLIVIFVLAAFCLLLCGILSVCCLRLR